MHLRDSHLVHIRVLLDVLEEFNKEPQECCIGRRQPQDNVFDCPNSRVDGKIHVPLDLHEWFVHLKRYHRLRHFSEENAEYCCNIVNVVTCQLNGVVALQGRFPRRQCEPTRSDECLNVVKFACHSKQSLRLNS